MLQSVGLNWHSKNSMLDIPKKAEVLFFRLLGMNNINMLQDVIFWVVT